jgi:hypothetical protein
MRRVPSEGADDSRALRPQISPWEGAALAAGIDEFITRVVAE